MLTQEFVEIAGRQAAQLAELLAHEAHPFRSRRVEREARLEEDAAKQMREFPNDEWAAALEIGGGEDRFTGRRLVGDSDGKVAEDGIGAALPKRGAEAEILGMEHGEEG